MYNSDYWLDIKMVWKNWPDREISGALKWYILVQFAFWLQQIVIVNIEERRKDHVQMFTHHIITCMLLFTSYGYHQTKVANVILCLMDVVDLFLPVRTCPHPVICVDSHVIIVGKVSQVSWLWQNLRCFIYYLHDHVGDSSPRVIYDGLLFDLA